MMTDDISEIIKKLDELTPKSIKALENVMEDALGILKTDAKANAPVAKKNGGELRDSIFSRKRRRGNMVMGSVGSRAEHAVHVEYGTSKMPARPYLYPALKAKRQRIRGMFENALNTGLREESGDG